MKVLKYVICLLAMAMLTLSINAFGGAGSGSPLPGQGDQNHNKTGEPDPDPGTGPGPGPRFDPFGLSCLSAIASQNPVLILDACTFLNAERERNKYLFILKLQHKKRKND